MFRTNFQGDKDWEVLFAEALFRCLIIFGTVGEELKSFDQNYC